MAKDPLKRWSRVASALLVPLILAVGAMAFNFGSNHLSTTTVVGPPQGSLQLQGSFPQTMTINTTSTSSFVLKDASNVDIRGIYLNLTATLSGINYSSITVQIAGENVLQSCGNGVCWYLSDRSWDLYANTQMNIDVSLNVHVLGQVGLNLWAYGSGG